MVDVFASIVVGLQHVLTWPNVGLMLAGVAIGFVVGLLPGLGGPTALALLLPLTISLEPTSAFAMLIGVAAVTATAGDLTSILLGVPGEATAAAVVLDGHAMTRRGEAARAAGAAMGASFLGGLVGIAALVVVLPIVRPLITAIQSPELAMLAVAGMCLAAPLARGSWTKVIVAAGLGVLVSTVGLDPRYGLERFTFNQLYLLDGIGLMSVALGLFALPELIALSSAAVSLPAGHGSSRGQIRRGLGDAITHLRLVTRSAVLGAGVGVVPGVGASVSQWLAYAGAARSLPSGRTLGTGQVEGVVAPCAATNATLGGALVPTVALGIPGSLSTALLLGALTLKGLSPGTALLTPDRAGGQLSLVCSLAWLLLFANVISVGLGLVSLGWLSRIADVPGRLLFPVVASFILLGAFAERSSAADIVIVAVIGALGWAMARSDWPRAPLVMGVVLGPLLERRAVIATELHGASWLLRPGVLLILAAVLVASGRFARSRRRQARPASPGASASWRSEGAVVIVALGLMTVAMVASVRLPFEVALLPRIIASVCLPLLLVHAVRLAKSMAGDRPGSSLGERLALGAAGRREGLEALGWLAGLLAAVGLLGFVGGTALWGLCYVRATGAASWARSVAIAGGLSLALGLVLRAMNASGVTGWLWSVI